MEIVISLFQLILVSVVIKNFIGSYMKLRRKYNKMWTIDYFNILFNTIRLTMIDIIHIFRRVHRLIYRYFKFEEFEYNYNEVQNSIKSMTPREFELFCANLLNESKKYMYAKATEVSCDGGKDVIARDSKGNKVYVECKHYREGHNVGRPEVQKLIGACAADGVKKSIFITTSSYSSEAIEYAKKIDGLELWDMRGILNFINTIERRRIAYVLSYLEE